VGLLQGEKPFYFDSGNYWILSKTFISNGHFSLFNFEYLGLRGYCIPLLFLLWSDGIGGIIGNDFTQVVLLNSALFALIGCVLIPRLALATWPEAEWGLLRRLAATALLLVFWRGFLDFPLSDFPALAAALLAIVAVSSGSAGALFLAGLAIGFATNARPAYLLLFPLLFGIVVWAWIRGSSLREALHPRRVAAPALFLVGIAIVTLPQMLVHHHSLGKYSPLPGGGELAQLQYTVGLELDLYETYVGTPEGVFEYLDPDTPSVIRELEGGQVSGTPEYFELILKHPMTMARLFGRHLIDGLDSRSGTPYDENLPAPSRRPLRVAGFLLVFLALLRVLWPRARRSLGVARWQYPAVLLLVATAALPTAMEQRFLLPIFALSVMLCLAPGWPNPIEVHEKGWRRFRTLLLIGAGAAVFFSVVAVTIHSANNHFHYFSVEEGLKRTAERTER
jgi:hypothetical protein